MLSAIAQQQPFTVRDSIEMTTLSDPNALVQNSRAKFSPDGKHFLVVATRGILKSDQLESCLMVFETSGIGFIKHETTQISKQPKCLVKVGVIPHVPHGIISEARWSADSQSIYFLGQGQQAERYLYRVDIRLGKVDQLSPTGYDILQFDFAKNAVIYVASHPTSRNAPFGDGYGQTINRDARDITGMSLHSVLFPGTSWSAEMDLQVWVKVGEERATMIAAIPKPLSRDADLGHNVFALSPDGSKAVTLVPVRTVPLDWDSYEPAQGFETWKIHAENTDPSTISGSWHPLKQYALIDLHKKEIVPLVKAPTGTALGYYDSLKAVWSENSRRLLLTDTFMPIGSAGAELLAHPLRPCAIASIDLVQESTRCIVPSRREEMEASPSLGAWRVVDLSFGTTSDEVSATFLLPQQKTVVETYQDTSRGWVGLSNDSKRRITTKRDQKIEVYVRQGLNDPPTLWAKSVATEDQVQVWDPNPELMHISYGEASMYHWKDSSGYEWSGILVKPVGYVKGQRYPLVIQTHGYSDWAFVTDGYAPSAMAARPLASAGITVLQTDYRHDIQLSPQEAGIEADKFESAVRQLDVDGLVDTTRVGVIGFSHTCWQVEATLINKPTLFKAATMADGIDNSYIQYHLFATAAETRSEFDRANGGPPVGTEGLKKWLALAPGFRLDEVKAAVRLESYGEGAPLAEWEIYSSLRNQGKAVDMIYIPSGEHILQKPLERMASQQGNVDWFRFWLQDYEDPDPSKAEQYKRWESLKRQTSTVSIN